VAGVDGGECGNVDAGKDHAMTATPEDPLPPLAFRASSTPPNLFSPS
jgi:hypothetical protein